MKGLQGVMDHGASEFWGFENFGGRYDVMKRVREKNRFFVDLRLRLELILDGHATDFKTEKRFQETDRLAVVCDHLGYDTTPGGFVRGAQGWGKLLGRLFLRANSVLRGANSFGMSKIDVKLPFFPISTFICHLFPKFKE